MTFYIDTSLNGLVSSALPNIYMKRIKLEQRGFKAPTKDKFGESLYIDQAFEKILLAGGDINPITGPGEDEGAYNYPNPEALFLTFDMTIQAPFAENEIFEFLLDGDLLKYVWIEQVVFFNVEGRTKYMEVLQKDPLERSTWMSPWVAWPANEAALEAYSGPGYKRLLPYPVSQVMQHAAEGKDNIVGGLGIDFFKTTLPDGTQIHEIPVTVSAAVEAPGIVDTSFLATISTLSLNINQMKEDMSDALGGADVPFDTVAEIHSKSTSNWLGEVIIKNGETQKTGMMFTISSNQEASSHVHFMSKDKKIGYKDMAGQVWLGDVHIAEVHRVSEAVLSYYVDEEGNPIPPAPGSPGTETVERYMAGSHHTPGALHPYLDVHYVDNNKIQDFRQVARFNKLIFDFSSLDDMFFGGSYKQLGNRQTEVSLSRQIRENMAVFSPLMSSVAPFQGKKAISLFFGLDLGKAIKKNCAIPSLLDKLASKSALNPLQNLMGAAKLISLQIYRQRIDIPDTPVDTASNKKLIYFSGAPLATAYSSDTQSDEPGPSTSLRRIDNLYLSAPDAYILNTFNRYYMLKDKGLQELNDGKFEYSVVFEFKDPTIEFLKELWEIINKAVNDLSQYARKALMGNNFNSYTGAFKKSFINEMYFAGGPGKNVENLMNPMIIELILNILKSPKIQETISASQFSATLLTMLDLQTATPDSIIAVKNMFERIVSDLERYITSFSKAKPKTDQLDPGYYKNYEGDVYTQGATTKRVFSVEHTFREIVDTTDKDAGYDFLNDITPIQNFGLREYTIPAYRQRITAPGGELSKIFVPGPQTGFDAAFIITMQGQNKKKHITQNMNSSAYSYLTLPRTPGAVILPEKYKKNLVEDNFINLIYSIISYKRDVPAAFTIDGTEPMFSDIGDGLESKTNKNNILLTAKKNLILAEMGVKLIDPAQMFLEIQAMALMDDLSGFPIGAGDSPEPLETYTKDINIYNQDVPDLKLSLFMSSLININNFSLGINDFLLSKYDTSNANSPINQMFWPSHTGWNGDPNTITMLPNPIKALMLANNATTSLILNPNIKHPDGQPKVYGQDSKQLFLKQFGNFWFKHQNIVEVQYLANFESIHGFPYGDSKIPVLIEDPITGEEKWEDVDISLYEEKFSTTIKSPVWKMLTSDTLAAAQTAQRTLLCRLKKYKNELYNSKAYEIMDLPLYGKHFLLVYGASGGLGG